MIFPLDADVGSVALSPAGPFVTGAELTLTVTFTVGAAGLTEGAQLRVGLPNTGWERVVVPQRRYWDELIEPLDQRFAPFHPVNTSVALKTTGRAAVHLETMERMLLPDEDPAEAYWRWWIGAVVSGGSLMAGDQVVLTYGDPQFIGRGARIQTFPEQRLTVYAVVDGGSGAWVRPANSPIELDVVAGPAARANLVLPSVVSGSPRLKIAVTDACHCRPAGEPPNELVLRTGDGRHLGGVRLGTAHPLEMKVELPADTSRVTLADASDGRVWGMSNPCTRPFDDGLQLFWGDLHAQSEYHVMHSQKKNARQAGWSRGISCGTPDEVYQYARETSLLDFVAITDQGGNTGVGWEVLQQKAVEYYQPGEFVTFKSFEAGSPVGHRNVYFRTTDVEPPDDPQNFSYLPDSLYERYRGRDDVMLIPHHVKTWTDWSFHDPNLEPLMEVYSCWGQSENPSDHLWNKGMTPGAGAWEALARGYKLGMIASSDNHVGMPGRSYPHDRQVHTPFPGGLAAVWAPELTREAIFDALRTRRCYGTTGARIIVDFKLNDQPMGSILSAECRERSRTIQAIVHGTDRIARVEIVRNGDVARTEAPETADDILRLHWQDQSVLKSETCYYLRVHQVDGEMAWSSPIWI